MQYIDSSRSLERLRKLLNALVRVDDGVLSLGARLRQLREDDPHGLVSQPGRNGALFQHVIELQAQIKQWVEPIRRAALEAEAACFGISSQVEAIVDDSIRWETDLREKLRCLRDALTSLPHSHGAQQDEQTIVSLAFGLCVQGIRLQDGFATLEARESRSTIDVQAAEAATDQAPQAAPSATRLESGPVVQLGRPGEACVVLGQKKKPLTDGQHAVVSALLQAGDEGMNKDALEAVRASARRILKTLREDADWAEVILLPGQTNGRYRIRA